MSNSKLRIIICSLIFFAAMGFVGLKDVDAYSGGLLDGKAGTWTFNGSSVTSPTDGNVSTKFYLDKDANLVYNLDKPANITSFRINLERVSDKLFIGYYDASGNLLKSYVIGDPPYQLSNGDHTITDSVNGVSKIILHRTVVGWYSIISEFDVFGTYVVPFPTNLVAHPDDRLVRLTWDDVPDPGFLGYSVYMDGQLLNTTPTMNKTFTKSGLFPDESHTFYVVSNYSIGQSQPSVSVIASAYADSLLKPTLTADEFTDHIEVKWNAITGGVLYRLDINNGQDIQTLAWSTTSYNHSGLALNTSVTYALTVIDKYGRETTSDVMTFTTRPPPPPVLPEVKLLNVTYDTISLSWTDLGGPYSLYKDGQLVSNNLMGNTFGFNGTLDPNTEYTFKVSYVDAYGRLVESADYKFKTNALPAVIVPVLNVSSITDKTLRLTWNQSGDSYKVYQDGQLIKDTVSTFHPVYNLNENTDYSYYVVAIDQFGRQTQSATVNVKTLQTPPPPPPPPPPVPPPPVSNSGNPDLNKVNDYLVQGADDAKENSLVLIVTVILGFIFIFGVMWLIKIFKRFFMKAPTGKASSTSVSSGAYRPARSGAANRSPAGNRTGTNYKQSNYKNQNNNAQRGNGKRKIYVEKSYRTSTKRSFKR